MKPKISRRKQSTGIASIDLDTYERQRDKLRQELTLTQIDRHSVELDEFDVAGILAFAERVLPRASALWCRPR